MRRLRRCRGEAPDHPRRPLHAVLADEGFLRGDGGQARRGGQGVARRPGLQVPAGVRDAVDHRRLHHRREAAHQGEERAYAADVHEPHRRFPVRARQLHLHGRMVAPHALEERGGDGGGRADPLRARHEGAVFQCRHRHRRGDCGGGHGDALGGLPQKDGAGSAGDDVLRFRAVGGVAQDQDRDVRLPDERAGGVARIQPGDGASLRRRPRVRIGRRGALDDHARPAQVLQDADEPRDGRERRQDPQGGDGEGHPPPAATTAGSGTAVPGAPTARSTGRSASSSWSWCSSAASRVRGTPSSPKPRSSSSRRRSARATTTSEG